MKLRGIIALALAPAVALSLMCAPTLAQTNPGTSPLSIAKGGTAAATASAARASLGLTIGSAVQAWDADLDALAALSGTNTIYYRSGSSTWAAVTIGGMLSFVAGTLNVADAELVALAGLTSAADKVPYFTGSGTAAVADFSVLARTLLANTTNTQMRSTLGVVIGTDVQAFDADLSALAANSTAGFWAYTGAGTGAARTLAAPAAGFTITNPAGTAGNPTFVLANDLAALEGLSSTGLAARTATDTWALRSLAPPAAGFTITNPAGVAGDPTFVLANDLGAVEGLSCTGVAVRSATDTWFCRTIGGTANEISVANGDGVSGAPAISLPAALTFTGKTITGGTFSGPTISGLANFSGARRDSTQSTPSQITSNQNDYNPSSVVCSSSSTLLINSDAARDITGFAGGAAGCDLFLFNNGNFTITLKDGSASSTVANRLDLGADFALGSKAAAHLKYDGNSSRWRNTTGSGSGGGGSGTVTQVNTAGAALGGPITTSGTVTVTVATKSDQQAGSSAVNVVTPSQQQSHPSAVKAWVRFTGSSGAILEAYNVTSITRAGAGQYTLNFPTAFANTTYACMGSIEDSSTNGIVKGSSSGRTGGGFPMFVVSFAGSLYDPSVVDVACFGTQ
ncbi:hypothetical protein [Bradyrhizobium sp. Bra78]|uniref:hypothetical protein n=1 Tax=Bradyrhizobium sp. Bra78 TaxID=2926010 RepID=UPI0021C6231B|nr:hypothetical protein [Bradyrhizobium sp. Bra78]